MKTDPVEHFVPAEDHGETEPIFSQLTLASFFIVSALCSLLASSP